MKTIQRKRIHKTRYELTNGECFWGLHFWKYSLYIAKPVSRLQRTGKLKAIKDVAGVESITVKGASV